MIPGDPKTLRIFKLFFIGAGVKGLGYLLIIAGIFMGYGNKPMGLKLICLGIVVVAIGWIILLFAYKESKS